MEELDRWFQEMMDKMVPNDDDFMKGMQQQMEVMMKGLNVEGGEEALQKATEEAVKKDAEMAAGEFMGKKKEGAEGEKKTEHKEL